MLFCEQSFFFIMLILHVWFRSDGERGMEGEGERGGGEGGS